MAYSDHFSLANIPYGIASTVGEAHRDRAVVTRIADKVVFLSDLTLDVTDGVKAALKQVCSMKDTKAFENIADSSRRLHSTTWLV
jgi:hypothetical protein